MRILSGKKIYEEKYARLERMVHAICEEHPNDMPTGRKIARWFYGKYEIAINHNVITGNIEIIPLQKAWLLASSDAVFIGTELRVGHEEESQEITDVIKQRFGKIVTAIFLQHLGEYPSLNNMKKWLKERFPKMNHAIQPYVDYLAIQLRWIENCDIEILLRSIRAYTFAPMLRDDERVKLAEKKLGSISESDLARYRGYMGRKRQRGMRLPADGIGGTKQTARLRSVI
ncbi:TPA: hypothetical protein HA238_05790 [Candidatus Micrarchaeota archaeon]|nr:hypothetical protein [Candidatus Micrarchaeota archaeon]